MYFEVTEHEHDIWRIDERYVNISERGMMFFVRGRDRDLLIDGGYGVVPLRENVPLVDSERTVFVASHTHFDHVGAAWEFAERWVHQLEAHVLVEPTQENTLIWPYLERRDVFDMTPPQWVSSDAYNILPAPPTRILHHGDLIDLGDRHFEVLHTPGHSPGSICLWEAATGVLFSADVLYDGTILDEIDGASIPDLLHSHQRLMELPIKTVHPGHYDSFSGKKARQIMAQYRAWRG
ncbi:MAG: MBL fold metallo-hydrolase [Ardenticatenaceae bacterium]